MAQQQEQPLLDALDKINLGYAMRAVMGFGKGKDVMAQIHARNPEYYEDLMARAREILREEFKSDVNAPDL